MLNLLKLYVAKKYTKKKVKRKFEHTNFEFFTGYEKHQKLPFMNSILHLNIYKTLWLDEMFAYC